MANFFGIKIDTSNMTLEELDEAQKKTEKMSTHLKRQILMRKMSKHKHSSTQSTPR